MFKSTSTTGRDEYDGDPISAGSSTCKFPKTMTAAAYASLRDLLAKEGVHNPTAPETPVR